MVGGGGGYLWDSLMYKKVDVIIFENNFYFFHTCFIYKFTEFRGSRGVSRFSIYNKLLFQITGVTV